MTDIQKDLAQAVLETFNKIESFKNFGPQDAIAFNKIVIDLSKIAYPEKFEEKTPPVKKATPKARSKANGNK